MEVPTGPIIIDTIGKMFTHEHGLAAHCRDCGHLADIDLAALAERLGSDHFCSAAALAPKMRCGKCGSRDIGFIVSGQAKKSGMGNAHAHPLPAAQIERPNTVHRSRSRKGFTKKPFP
jgi:hypothetical protein